MIDTLINIFVLLAILVGLVLLHELGHFVMAKRAGVKVHEFGIGFPPRAMVLFRRGETAYTLNWLPIGGFVRMEGEEGESVDPRAFINQKLGRRLRILIAGVIVNFVFAWLIFSAIAFFAQPNWSMRVGEVAVESPASRAGLIAGQVIGQTEPREVENPDGSVETVGPFDIYDDSGDLIVAVDGRMFPVFDDFASVGSRGQVEAIGPIRYLVDHAGETVTLTVQRSNGQTELVDVTLRAPEELSPTAGALGVSYRRGFVDSQNGLVESAAIGMRRTVEASTLILRGVGELLVALLEPGEPLPVAGPVGITSMVGAVREALPPVFLVWFVGLLSANLAVINVLPFPPMDGGRITMAFVQAASRNKVSPAAERMVYVTGFVLLMTLLVIVTISDIQRLSA